MRSSPAACLAAQGALQLLIDIFPFSPIQSFSGASLVGGPTPEYAAKMSKGM
jgi:hypothetical protein